MKVAAAGRRLWRNLFGGAPEIEPGELKEMLATRDLDSFTLLDVRQPSEYQDSHIPGALLIPLPQLADRLEELDPGRPVVTYCAVGARSAAAAEMLRGRGFEDTASLAGGIRAWEGETALGPVEAGLSLAAGAETPAQYLIAAATMERGLAGFYRDLGGGLDPGPVKSFLEDLAQVEDHHLARIAELFERAAPSAADRALWQRGDRDVLEGGFDVEELLAARGGGRITTDGVLDQAITIEAQAMDLYLRMARRAADAQSSETLRGIAGEERAHLRHLGELREALTR